MLEGPTEVGEGTDPPELCILRPEDAEGAGGDLAKPVVLKSGPTSPGRCLLDGPRSGTAGSSGSSRPCAIGDCVTRVRWGRGLQPRRP